jgi:transposase
MFTMPKRYPMEFRRDVVQVARNREPGVSLEKIGTDFRIHPVTLSTWLKQANIEDGVKPGIASEESVELREANKRIRLLEQEAEVLKRALAYVWQGSLPGRDYSRS